MARLNGAVAIITGAIIDSPRRAPYRPLRESQ